jgi:hypothetical protein
VEQWHARQSLAGFKIRCLAAGGTRRERRAMLAHAYSAAISGVDAHVARVESDSAAGTPGFLIVGLPDSALNERASACVPRSSTRDSVGVALALRATDEQHLRLERSSDRALPCQRCGTPK